MRRLIGVLAVFTITANCLAQQTANELIEKTISELNNIEQIKYYSSFEAIENGIAYSQSMDTVYFDFTEVSENRDLRYILSNLDARIIYDGKDQIATFHKDKLIVNFDPPAINNPLLLTLYPLKKLLPETLNNKLVEISREKDTLIGNRPSYKIDLKFSGGRFDWNSLRVENMPSGFSDTITIFIGKSDYYPTKITMYNGLTGSLSRTFEEYEPNYKLADAEWAGLNLPEDYQHVSLQEYTAMLQEKPSKNIGQNANLKFWKLKDIETNRLVDFSNLSHKLVLLEFWFKHCGPCVQAVPFMNDLQTRFENKGLAVFGVEFNENFPRENLLEYLKKIQVKYPSLYQGKEMSINFEVNAAPTFLLFDNEGSLLFSTVGLDKEELLKAIESNL
ncbi:TlpA family protein disulfide reductase [Sinomicrobium sp. M5D2P9]